MFLGELSCPRAAVEVLFYCNDRCAGKGHLAVCPIHLAEHRREHLL